MTKEELEKEAEEYANNLLFVFETDIVQRIVRERVRLALIDVLEPREKRIKDLEAQIEKMKSVVISERDEALQVEDIIAYGVLNDVLDEWEIKEND